MNSTISINSIWSCIQFETELRMENISMNFRIRLKIDKYSNKNILRTKKPEKIVKICQQLQAIYVDFQTFLDISRVM